MSVASSLPRIDESKAAQQHINEVIEALHLSVANLSTDSKPRKQVNKELGTYMQHCLTFSDRF